MGHFDTTSTQRGSSTGDAGQLPVAVVVQACDAGRFPEAPPLAMWRAEGGLVFGRGERTAGEGAVVVIDDPHVSRRHARLYRSQAHVWVLEDLGSRNGTLHEGLPIAGPVVLSPGEPFEVGPCTFVLQMGSREDLDALAEDERAPLGPVPTRSLSMAPLVSLMRRLAPTDLEVLLGGETGVGKEVYAEAIHRASGRKGPFVAVNCAAIPEALLESELYGYRKGAHSSAHEAKPGLVEEAQGGTLFLDEIGDMSHGAQAKLLRFLQTREYQPLGAPALRKADVRVIAATRFAGDANTALRPDLLARLGPRAIEIPPLRDRRADIPSLAALFARRLGRTLSASGLRALCTHRWPGNVRELEKTLKAAALVGDPAAPIGDGALKRVMSVDTPPPKTKPQPAPPSAAASATTTPRRSSTSRPTESELRALLQEHGGDVPSVARHLGRNRTLVWRWLKQHGLDPREFHRI